MNNKYFKLSTSSFFNFLSRKLNVEPNIKNARTKLEVTETKKFAKREKLPKKTFPELDRR